MLDTPSAEAITAGLLTKAAEAGLISNLPGPLLIIETYGQAPGTEPPAVCYMI